MFERATMITADAAPDAAVVLRTVLRLDRPASEVVSAKLRATAHGIYEARIDGTPVSDALFSPGWTSYEWRLQVQEYDVTALVRDGAVLEVLLGNGWWRGNLGFGGGGLNYGTELGFIAELTIVYAGGAAQVVATGPHWTARASDVTENSLYNGERIDARLRGSGQPLPVRDVEFDRTTLVEQVKPPVLRQQTLPAARIWSSPTGKTLVDFGQNITGWVRLRAHGPEGEEVTVRHAEVLENAEIGTRPLRLARATDTFVLSGGEDIFEPTLTFHGFRYAEVSGYPGILAPSDLEAVVVHSEIPRTGTFECSSELVNRLVENSIWGQRGNFLDVPTDCPQRDERMGWTGDIAAYAATACYQFDCADVLHGWLLDLAAEANHSGFVPFVVPDILKLRDSSTTSIRQAPTAVWGDAAVWVPQALWHAYGDRERLAAHYPAMVRHLESVEARLSPSGLWDTGFQFGDWLDPAAPPDRPGAARADRGVVATACLFRSASFAAEAARALGMNAGAARWQALANRTRDAFLANYVDSEGNIRSDCATVYALAICFGLLEGQTRAHAGQRLAQLSEEAGYHVATGFAGTPFVTWALSETGHTDAAYRLLLQTECPSFLYPVTMGATTIWERWDAMLPDGSINPGEMTSFNHYALGAVVDWLYKVVAGIRPAAPGYSRVLLQPMPGPGLDWANATLETRHGRIECGWRRVSGQVEVSVDVPNGIEAEVVLPDGQRRSLTGGRHVLTARSG